VWRAGREIVLTGGSPLEFAAGYGLRYVDALPGLGLDVGTHRQLTYLAMSRMTVVHSRIEMRRDAVVRGVAPHFSAIAWPDGHQRLKSFISFHFQSHGDAQASRMKPSLSLYILRAR
jgi:hypothetical protein